MKNKFLILGLVLVAIVCMSLTNKNTITTRHTKQHFTDTQYACMPCGSSCDKAIYNKPGMCSHCNMILVDKASIKFKQIEPATLCNFIAGKGQKNIILLDVRSVEEFDGTATEKFGRLAGAINIPVQDLEKRIAELAKYKQSEIVVYCSHSRRSPRASYLLTQNGFTKVTNVEFGMSEWKNKVKPNSCTNKLYVNQ
jgi:rhodanese-related sulfurtransferase